MNQPPPATTRDTTRTSVPLRHRLLFPLSLAFLLGTALQAAAWITYADSDLLATATAVANGDSRPGVSETLMVASTPFWIAGAATLGWLAYARSPRLAIWGTSLVAIGLCGLATNLGTEVMTQALLQHHVLTPDEAVTATTGLATLAAQALNLGLLVGLTIGLPLLATGVWRSAPRRRLPAALLVTFLATDLAAQGAGLALLGQIGHLLALAAAVLIAIDLRPVPGSV